MEIAGCLGPVFRLMTFFSFTAICTSQVQPGHSPKTFMPVLTIPDGNRTCAVDEPSKVVSLMGVGGFADVAQCSMQCTRDADCCSGYNLKIDMKLCEIYDYIPTRFALVPGCEHRQVYEAKSKYLSEGCDEEGEEQLWTNMFNESSSPSNTSGSPCWILVEQSLEDGLLDFFNRNWESYRQGFGDASGNFWAGNEFLHQMTQVFHTGCRLRVEVKITRTEEWLWAEYDNITVDSEDNKYTVHVTGYHGNAGDAFNDDNYFGFPSNGMPFSTHDVDNDKNPHENCAGKTQYGCGWWFNACSSSAVNSPEYRLWGSASENSPTSVSASRMMIRCGQL